MTLNSKTLKAFRKIIRAWFPNIPARETVFGKPRTYLVPDYARGLKSDGTPHMVPFTSTGTNTNLRESQRGQYRKVKQVLRGMKHPATR